MLIKYVNYILYANTLNILLELPAINSFKVIYHLIALEVVYYKFYADEFLDLVCLFWLV